jgi:hypothetical protein
MNSAASAFTLSPTITKQLPSPHIMSTAAPGERDQRADPSYSAQVLEAICIEKEKILQLHLHQRQRQQPPVEHLFETIPKSQQAKTHKMLTLYRDDTPGAYIPQVSGAVPTIVDLKLPVIYRRDLKVLMRQPEPRRTANWIRMSFVADDNYIASSGVLYKAYFEALTPLKNELDRKTPLTTPTTPLLSPSDFSATLEKQIEGYEPYSWNGKSDAGQRYITRGVRARAEALTFRSTSRKRDLRQLEYYKKKGDLVYPEGDPNKRSTFSKKLAHDPLFMLPRETQSPLVNRMIANSAKYDGVLHYDGKETEDPGFPGVSIEKKNKKGKERKKGSSTGWTQGATAPGQTDAQYLASVEADWNAMLKEQCNKLKDKATTGDLNSTSWTQDEKLLPQWSGSAVVGQISSQLASFKIDRMSVGGSGSIDSNVKEQGDTQGKERGQGSSTSGTQESKLLSPTLVSSVPDRMSVVSFGSIDKNAKEQGGTQRDQKTTGERSTNVAMQRFAADIGWNPSSAEGAPPQEGLFQSTALERVITRTAEKKKPKAGAGRVSKKVD